MAMSPLPSAALNASVLPPPSVARTVARAVVVVLGALLLCAALLVCLRLIGFEFVRAELVGFFRDQIGMQRHSALAIGLGGAIGLLLVFGRSAWRLGVGSLTPLLALGATLMLIAFWGLSEYFTTPMSPQGRINQKYVIVEGRCAFFDAAATIEPHTGKPLRVVTADVLQACAARKNGKAPKAVDVSRPESVDWFDRVLGYPNVYYAQRPNGRYVFFDAPGADPLTGEPLAPVTPDVVMAATEREEEPSPLPPPGMQVVPAMQLFPTPGAALTAASKSVGTPSRMPAPLLRSTAPAATRQALVWSGPVSEHADAVLGQLQRRGIVNAPLRLNAAWSAAPGRPDADVLAQAQHQGAGTVVVVSLQAEVKTQPQLAGFSHAVLHWVVHIYDSSNGTVLGKHQQRAEGRGFSEREAIAEALASLS